MPWIQIQQGHCSRGKYYCAGLSLWLGGMLSCESCENKNFKHPSSLLHLLLYGGLSGTMESRKSSTDAAFWCGLLRLISAMKTPALHVMTHHCPLIKPRGGFSYHDRHALALLCFLLISLPASEMNSYSPHSLYQGHRKCITDKRKEGLYFWIHMGSLDMELGALKSSLVSTQTGRLHPTKNDDKKHSVEGTLETRQSLLWWKFQPSLAGLECFNFHNFQTLTCIYS